MQHADTVRVRRPGEPAIYFYKKPPLANHPARNLIARVGSPDEEKFVFFQRIEIGRYHPERPRVPGLLMIDEPTISSRHCVINQAEDGTCIVRDVSRNGTRVDGRRLVPSVESRIQPGQTLTLGASVELELGALDDSAARALAPTDSTSVVPGLALVTVLVGDIRNYTTMVREAKTDQVQSSMRGLLARLEEEVEMLGGTLKEYQGDAILAFWDQTSDKEYAASACHAALELDKLVRGLAAERTLWDVEGFPLAMDWALSTGAVVIETMGGDRPTGLSMVGEAVVRAYRTEKLANDDTGNILACEATKQLAGERFRFADVGAMTVAGFDEPQRVYSIQGQAAD